MLLRSRLKVQLQLAILGFKTNRGGIWAVGLLAVMAASTIVSVAPLEGWAKDSPKVSPPAQSMQSVVQPQNDYPIDLTTTLKLTEDQNLVIAQKQKNAQVFHSRLRQKQVAFLPSIEGTFTQSRLEGGQQIFGGEVVSVTRKTVQPQASATWTLYPGGKTLFEALAARRRSQSAQLQASETIQQQLALASQEYYKLLAAQVQALVAQQAVAEAEAQVAINQAKVNVGKGVPLDLSRAQTTLAQQKSSLVQAQNAMVLAEQTLLNRLNLDPNIHLHPNLEEAVQKRLVDDTVPVSALMAHAVETNPSIQTGNANLKALGLDHKAVMATVIPSVTLRGYVNGTGPDRESLVRTTFTGVTVSMNLFENMGLQVPYRVKEAKQLVEQQILAQAALVRDVQTQVMTAFLNSQNYLSALQAAQQQVKSAQESYELATGRYNAGYGLNIDVLDAEVALSQARNAQAQALLNYNQSQVQLVQALGLVTPQALTEGVTLPVAVQTASTSSP
jgi:outer membrane protein